MLNFAIEGEALGKQHTSFINGLKASIFDLLRKPIKTLAHRQIFEYAVRGLTSEHKAHFISVIESLADRIFVSAISDASKDTGYEVSDEFMQELRDYTSRHHEDIIYAVSFQVDRDLRKSLNFVNEFMLRSSMLQLNTNHTNKSSGYKIQLSMQESLDFNYVDALHRNVQSGKFIRTAISKYFTDLYNNLYILVAMAAGKEEFAVDRAGHESDGYRFNLDEYEELKNTLFHPLSNGRVIVSV